jgi:YD repeat-containing protein
LSCPGFAGCSSELGPAVANGEEAQLGYDINPGIGNLFLEYNDIVAKPALGPALAFSRFYNSQGFNTPVGMGPGWTHTYSWQILQNGTQAEMLTSSGKIIYFAANGSAWTSPAGEFGTLTGSFANGFTYTDKTGTAFAFDKNSNLGRLLSITPANDTAITVTYTSGIIISKVQSGDLQLTFGYSGSNIASVQDPASNTWSYGYASGNLTTVTLPNTDTGGNHGKQQYTYSNVTVGGQLFSAGSQVGQITEIQELQTSGTWVTVGLFSYANPTTASSQVIAAASGLVGSTLLRTLGLSYSLCTTGTSTTTATLNGGAKTITSTNVSGLQRLTGLAATAGSGVAGEWTQASLSWNSTLTLASVTDGAGNQTLYQSYDGHGNPATVVEASGSAVQRTTSFTYHSVLSVPLTVTRQGVDGVSGHNHVTTFDYDSDYNSTYNQSPTNYPYQIVESGYTDTGLSGSLGTKTTSVVQLHYDSNHRVTSITGPLSGVQTSFTYWPSGTSGAAKNRLETKTVTTTSTSTLATTYASYDGDGRALQVTDPNTVTTTLVYQPTGEVTQSTVSDGTHSLQTATSYNLARQITTATTPEGQTENLEYDAAGRLWREHAVASDGTTPWSRVLDFDVWGRVVTDRRFTGLGLDEGQGCGSGGAEQFCKDLRYNAYGRQSLVLSPETGGMDCSGSKCQISYSYDNDLQLHSMTEVGLYTTTYGRDALERINQITLPTNGVSTIAFDINNHMISQRDPKDSHNGGSGGNGRLTTYLWDDYGRLVSITSPENGTWLYNFDLAGNRTSAKDPSGQQATYSYDLANRRTGLTEAGTTNDGISWAYDETGAVGGINYANTKGRLTSIQARDSSGNRIFSHYTYDFIGRVVAQIEERGTNASPTFKSIQYTWGQNSEPTLITYPDGMQETPKYPATGGYGPSPLPSELDVTYNSGSSAVVQGISYFSDGRPSSLTFGDSTTRTISRNLRGEVTHVTSGHTSTANVLDEALNQDSNGSGQINSVNWFPGKTNSWTWSYGYDALHRMTSYTTDVRPGSDSYTWSYDEVGNRTAETYVNASGTVATSYGFDSSNNTSQIQSATITSGTGSNRAYAYDANGQRSRFNPAAGNFTTYPYNTYTYNTRHQLVAFNSQTSATASTTLETYSYDGRGLRWQKTNSSTNGSTQFYYDRNGRILEEYATAANVNGCAAWTVTDHVYLGGSAEVSRVIKSYQSTSGCGSYSYVDKDLQYVHEDHRGVVFAIVGATAGLELENEIDPWGRVVCSNLPGADKKPCTGDDVSATAQNDFDGPGGIIDSESNLRKTAVDGDQDPALGGARLVPAAYLAADGSSRYSVNRHYTGILLHWYDVGPTTMDTVGIDGPGVGDLARGGSLGGGFSIGTPRGGTPTSEGSFYGRTVEAFGFGSQLNPNGPDAAFYYWTAAAGQPAGGDMSGDDDLASWDTVEEVGEVTAGVGGVVAAAGGFTGNAGAVATGGAIVVVGSVIAGVGGAAKLLEKVAAAATTAFNDWANDTRKRAYGGEPDDSGGVGAGDSQTGPIHIGMGPGTANSQFWRRQVMVTMLAWGGPGLLPGPHGGDPFGTGDLAACDGAGGTHHLLGGGVVKDWGKWIDP